MKKKAAALIGVMALSFAVLTGCGEKTPTAQELIDEAMDTTIESATINMDMDVDVTAEVNDEDFDFAFSAGIEMEAEGLDGEDILAHMTVSYDFDVLGMTDDDEMEMYIEMEDGEGVVYMNYDGDWYYAEADASDYGAEVDAKTLEKVQDATKEFMYEAEVGKDLEKVAGEECYVLTLKPSGEDLMDLTTAVLKAMDMSDDFEDACEELEDEFDVKPEDILDNLGLEMTYYISKENKYVVKTVVDFSGFDFEGMLESAGLDLDDLADDYGIEIGEVKVKALTFSAEYSDINDVEVEIPDDVVDEAIDIYNMYGGSGVVEVYDPDFDPEVDPEVDPVGGTTSQVSASSDYYNLDEGWFSLYDYYDNCLATLFVPAGYTVDLDWSSSYGTYYDLMDSNGSDFWIYAETSDDVLNYVLYGEIPEDDDWYEDYQYYAEEDEDLGIILVGEKFTSVSSGYEYTYIYVLFNPYTDTWGDPNYVCVDLPSSCIEEWGDEDFYGFIEELLGK